MTASAPAASSDSSPEQQHFSLVLGGPLFRFLCHVRLADHALGFLPRRIMAFSLLAWLPLLVLSAFERRLLGGAAVPFLMDVEVHVKFLLAVPLLLAAELTVHQRLRFIARQFLNRKLIPDNALSRFDAAIASVVRRRESAVAEALLIAFVYAVGISVIWRHYTSLDTATWYASSSAEGSKLSLAGIWYGYVSLPIFQFLLCRWYYRLFIWMAFLWKVSRIRLSLIPTHPDGTGGIGFLGNTIVAFMLLASAHGALLAGQIGERIFHLGALLTEFEIEGGIVLVFLLCMIVAPLLMFAPQLAAAKRAGRREYGTLAQHYVRSFDVKWLRGGAPAAESLLGSSDIQSLADLANSVALVQHMRIAPITRGAVLQLAGAMLVPMLPLALTVMPLAELVKALFKMLA